MIFPQNDIKCLKDVKKFFILCPFKTSAQSGGSGADDVARAAIEAHAGNADIHVTADEKAAWDGLSNPNLLINPDFSINQRGKTAYTGSTFTVDYWKKNYDGTITVGDTSITLSNGSLIRQPMEYADKLSGQKVTVSIKANGTIRSKSSVFPTDTSSFSFYYDEDVIITRYISDSVTWFVITARKEVSIEWVKLEVGGAATPFVSPDPAAELAKCQRYYQVRTTNDIDPLDLRPSMRTITDIKAVEGGYAYVAEL